MGYGNCESKSNVKSRAVDMENTAENHMTSKQQQWRIPSKSPINSGKTFLDISVNTGQICLGFEADTPPPPKKKDSNMPTVCDFRTKIWLKSYLQATESITF